MAKLQVLVMMTQLGGDMDETDEAGRGKSRRTFSLMEETMEAMCRVMLFVQDFNKQYEMYTEDESNNIGHHDQSDSYLRKTFYLLVGQYGLHMMKRGVDSIRHRSRKGKGEFIDGKRLELPNLMHELMEKAERLRVQGSDL